MKTSTPLSRPMAWFCVVVASLVMLLALFNLIFNTELVWSWLPLFILMPLSLVVGVRSLRALGRANR
ncbi:hypothetical protein [Cryobacterium sp. Hz9]|uniref:hypothetical protein n=1 Tax=Cryobacterium sp. Hz9 TaxID=1259167 RepID=UPI001069B9DF|nr:hypothetical protein [Cryobacterium sp. Hz9]TFB66851.1 hypothetical protein E3N85_09775 [Cryobacterium sp. Hz9]